MQSLPRTFSRYASINEFPFPQNPVFFPLVSKRHNTVLRFDNFFRERQKFQYKNMTLGEVLLRQEAKKAVLVTEKVMITARMQGLSRLPLDSR